MRALALLLSVTLTAAADNAPAMQMLTEWIAIVDQHAAGERDEALAQLGRWNTDNLDTMHAYVEALIDVPLDNPLRAARRRQISGNDFAAIKRLTGERRGGDLNAFRKRAALLHTDAATLEPMPLVVATPRPSSRNEAAPAVDVQHLDGRVEHYQAANPHWQFAMDILDALPAAPRRDPMVAQWYRGIGAYFAKQQSFGDAMRHFERARQTVPDDPGVMFGEACLQETLGSPAEQNFSRVTVLPNGLTLRGVSSPQTHFRRAEALLVRTLAAQPTFVDARLRLGRVLAEQKKYEAALSHFARVVADSQDPVLAYYAHLFSGDAALGLGRAAESRQSYERALAGFPNSQAARLGLGAAIRAAGDREGALAAIMLTLTAPPRTRDAMDDPWWEYYEGDAANVERLMGELRAPFRKPVR